MPSASGGHGGDDRIEVDPDVLIRAGQRLSTIGSQLSMIVEATTPVLEDGIASGWDPAGMNFGLEYSKRAQQLAQGLAGAANAGKALGAMLQASGYNYENADAQSTIGGSGPAGGVSGPPSETRGASIPSGPNHVVVMPPSLLAVLSALWPQGEPSMLKLLAANWANIGKGFAAFDDDVAAIKTVTSTQHVPEAGAIAEKLTNFAALLKSLTESTATITEQITKFADEVEKTQKAIRRLLDRMSSLEGFIDTVTDLFTGEAADIIDDIKQVLKEFQSQIKGIVGLFGKLGELLGNMMTEAQKLIRPYLVATFGDQVGNALATALDFYTDYQVGLVTGLLNTVSGTVALLDPDTWKGMYETVKSVVEDPSKLDDVLVTMGKGVIAYDALTGDHPGRGLGEAGFNIGTLFMPGGALSKTGTLAKGLRYGNKLLDEGRLPKLSDLPGVKGKVPSPRGAPGEAGNLPGVPESRPGAVPDSLVGPRAPDGINAPATPRDLGGPARSPDAPPPHTTPNGGGPGGGGGPPPDHPPGRPAGPPDATPNHPNGPTQQAPPNSVHAPSVSEPSAPSHAPATSDAPMSTTPHAPESPSPPVTHDSDRSPSEPGTSSTGHDASTPDPSPREQHGGQRGDAPGHGENAEHRAPPSEHGLRHEDQTHAPTEHQPAHTPSAEEPGTHDPATPEGVREQPRGDGEGRPSQPAANAPGFMGTPMMGTGHLAGTHSPSPSHAPGATHTPSAVPKADGPRAPRTESPRFSGEHAPKASGPAPGQSPPPPVKNPVSPAVSGAPTQPLRPESHSTREHAARRADGYPAPGLAHATPDLGRHDGSLAGDRDADSAPLADNPVNAPAPERYVELEDGSRHQVWASKEHLQALRSRFDDALAWLAERGLTKADVQRLLVLPADWLTPHQRDLIYGYRHQFPGVAPFESLQKIVDEDRSVSILGGGSEKFPAHQTGGSVSVAGDTRDLDSPRRIYDGLALGYDGTHFRPNESMVGMRFTVADDVPVHLPDGPLSNLEGHGPSFDPGYDYPFTGTGFTASDHFTVPEYFLDAKTPMNPGAEMYRIHPDGSETLLAVLNDEKKWIGVANNG